MRRATLRGRAIGRPGALKARSGCLEETTSREIMFEAGQHLELDFTLINSGS